MKCLILAGGCGDRLWPLSRKNYPKQFMEIYEGRSLIQETVVRNMPFCDEFLIVINQSCHFILEGQLKAFQGLRYRCFLEQEPRKTAAAISLVCMMENPTELIYVVSADTIAEGAGYQEAVLRGKELARKGALTAFGIPVTAPNTGYGYIRHRGEQVLSFTEKPDRATAEAYMQAGDYLWNSGNFLFRAGDYLQELKKLRPDVYDACRAGVAALDGDGGKVMFRRELLERIPAVSVEKAVFERSDRVKVVPGAFAWQDIGCLEDLENAPIHTNSRNTLAHHCKNVTVINRNRDNLVVANGLEDVIVVNTEDATYIGKKGASEELKEIMRRHEQEMGSYFEHNRVTYRPYGMYQVLASSGEYRVKKVTIYPGCSISFHRHRYRSEHWSVAEGTARISIQMGENGEQITRDYERNESIYVPVGMLHAVSNETDKNVVIIEVGIGQTVEETDIIRMEGQQNRSPAKETEPFVKLLPAYKDYLWGGVRLREQFGKQSDLERIAESWELSAHEAGQSVVAEGRYKGMLFGDYLQKIGRDAWGWKCCGLKRFPILIKLLDAREDLSVQVHPDDEYAMAVEKEYGKNELWYILDCEPDSAVYCGFTKDLEKEELRRRIREGTLTEVLNEHPIEKGDALFIPAGCVHAIKGGVLICEIQQNSNSTYRLYDYNRKDQYQNLRPLHVEKALQVLNLRGGGPLDEAQQGEERAFLPPEAGWTEGDGFRKRMIGSCKYFESVCYEVAQRADIPADEASFVSILIVEGSGNLSAEGKTIDFTKGDSFFVPAGKKTVRLTGCCRCIATRV